MITNLYTSYHVYAERILFVHVQVHKWSNLFTLMRDSMARRTEAYLVIEMLRDSMATRTEAYLVIEMLKDIAVV